MKNEKAKSPTVIRYIGVSSGPYAGMVIESECALEFALTNCGLPCRAEHINMSAPDAAEFCEMLVEWFYSGAWLAVDTEE